MRESSVFKIRGMNRIDARITICRAGGHYPGNSVLGNMVEKGTGPAFSAAAKTYQASMSPGSWPGKQ